jgi:predicted DsbA family dithiol-disulfide isomerase
MTDSISVSQRESERCIVIDATIDMNCPWCFFALRHLRTALSRVDEDVHVDIKFHPFILFPDLPSTGTDLTPCMLTPEVNAAAVSALVSINNDRLLLPTLNAHVVLRAAQTAGKGMEFVDALFILYFEQGRSINDVSVLAAAAVSAGMPLTESAVSAMTAQGSANIMDLLELERASRASGITKVPHFAVSEQGKRCKFEFKGALGPEVFEDAIAELDNLL